MLILKALSYVFGVTRGLAKAFRGSSRLCQGAKHQGEGVCNWRIMGLSNLKGSLKGSIRDLKEFRG